MGTLIGDKACANGGERLQRRQKREQARARETWALLTAAMDRNMGEMLRKEKNRLKYYIYLEYRRHKQRVKECWQGDKAVRDELGRAGRKLGGDCGTIRTDEQRND
jgi:hypothetical protein